MNRLTLRFFTILVLFAAIVFSASRQPLRAKHGVVASVNETASQIGVEVLKKGGNAVDAAIAVSFALAVVWPEAGNIGGGGFLLIRMADGRTEFIDYRETAPRLAKTDMYKSNPENSSIGFLASGVPGTVAGLEYALQKFGSSKWQDLIEPARKLAADGFELNDATVFRMRKFGDRLKLFPESKKIFLINGEFPQSGHRLIQPDLAATLQRLQENGRREFYEGETAQMIVNAMKAGNGIITMEDLAAYKPVTRKPISGSYRGCEIITAPLPSAGGIALLETLNQLENFDLQNASFHSTDQIHLLVETMKRAFADRKPLGDPDFAKISSDHLITKEYGKRLAAGIDLKKSTVVTVESSDTEGNSTTQISVIDRDGNVVSLTTTINYEFGSGAVVPGAGFLMNNEMDDFLTVPDTPNLWGLIQGHANAIAPGKRPLSSMAPTIVLKDGKPYLATGSPGGPMIPSAIVQVLVNLIDYKMQLQLAIEMPRFHHQWMPDQIRYELFGLNADIRKNLETRGHQFEKEPRDIGDVQAVMIDPETGMRLAASDPRRGGAPAGY